MAAPALVSAYFDPENVRLHATLDQAVTLVNPKITANDIWITDMAGRGYGNTNAALVSGSGTTAVVIQLARNATLDNSNGLLSIKNGTLQNAGLEANADITDDYVGTFVPKLASNAATGLTYLDVQAAVNVLGEIANGNIDATAGAWNDNLTDGQIGALTLGLKFPRTEYAAWALVDAHDKFLLSAKNPSDYAALANAIRLLRESLNARGTTAMLADGR